jgi:hypothetical protein
MLAFAQIRKIAGSPVREIPMRSSGLNHCHGTPKTLAEACPRRLFPEVPPHP